MTPTEPRETLTAARDVIVREDDFKPVLAAQSRGFGDWVAAVRNDPGLLDSGPVVTRIVQEAHDLETILDNWGARQNRTFVTFGEMVASARGLAAVSAAALHLANRLKRYQTLASTEPLESDLHEAQVRLNRAILAVLDALAPEGRQLGCQWVPALVDGQEAVRQRRLLPRNLDEAEAVDERQHIAEIGAKFLKVVETSRSLNLGFRRPQNSLAEFVAQHATEERCRWYESAVHSIQSMYDTFVLNTSVERDHPWLRALRGHASVAFHLLEMATGLVHFYERHEGDSRHIPARRAISAAVETSDILDIAVNVCLRHAYLYVESASSTANQILQNFVTQASATLTMPSGVTLHARPLALIAQVARHYGTPTEISFDGERCAANSLMSLIMVGGRHPRPQLVEAHGDSRMLRDLELLFESGLGEHGRPLPRELGYLRVGR